MQQEPEPRARRRFLNSRARIKKAKLKQLNLPDTSISFFEDIGLYREKNPKKIKRPSSYRSRRKAQFSK